MEFDSKEDEEQYERFMAKHSPQKFQKYMQMKSDRPAQPNFDAGDYEPASEEPVAATPLPPAEQPSDEPTHRLHTETSSLGGYPTHDSRKITDMLVAMQRSCDAMERAAEAKDEQITQLVAALATHKDASKKQADDIQQLRQQMAQLTAATVPRSNTNYDTQIHDSAADAKTQIPDSIHDSAADAKTKADLIHNSAADAKTTGMDRWEPVTLTTGDSTNQFDELVVSLCLPTTITSTRKDVFDVPSLVDYILKKRQDIKSIFKNADDTGYVLVEQAKVALNKIGATVRDLPTTGKILAAMQMMAVTGNDDRRGDIQLAVETALGCNSHEIRQIIQNVKHGCPMRYTRTNIPIARTRGMHAILQEAVHGQHTFIQAMYDLLMEVIADAGNTSHGAAKAKLLHIEGALPRHQIRYEAEWYDKTLKTLGPDAPAFWTMEQRMNNLIATRTEPQFTEEFFKDLRTNDQDWRRMQWDDITAHYEKISLRMELQAPISKPVITPATDTSKETRTDAEYCKFHGKGHSTQKCSLFDEWDPDICEQYRKEGLCFFAAADKCRKKDCKNTCPTVDQIKQLGDPTRPDQINRPPEPPRTVFRLQVWSTFQLNLNYKKPLTRATYRSKQCRLQRKHVLLLQSKM